MKRRASIDFLKNKIVLSSLSSDKETWIWVATPPFYMLDRVFDEQLILAVREVLNQSGEKIFIPSDYSPSQEIEKVLGIKMKVLHDKSVKSLLISQNDKNFDFIPTANFGRNKGFSHLNDKKVSVSITAPNEEILDALREAVVRCE